MQSKGKAWSLGYVITLIHILKLLLVILEILLTFTSVIPFFLINLCNFHVYIYDVFLIFRLFISSLSLYPISSPKFFFFNISMFFWWNNYISLSFFPNVTAVALHKGTLLQNAFWPELCLLPHSRTKVNQLLMPIYDIYVYVLSHELTCWSLYRYVAPAKDLYFFSSPVWSLEDQSCIGLWNGWISKPSTPVIDWQIYIHLNL